MRFITVLAIFCVLAGSAFAVERLTHAVVDSSKCLGCGSCVKHCPNGAICQDDDGIAKVNAEKCTGCKSCVKVCPNEAIRLE